MKRLIQFRSPILVHFTWYTQDWYGGCSFDLKVHFRNPWIKRRDYKAEAAASKARYDLDNPRKRIAESWKSGEDVLVTRRDW